jgi:hypothetical protein
MRNFNTPFGGPEKPSAFNNPDSGALTRDNPDHAPKSPAKTTQEQQATVDSERNRSEVGATTKKPSSKG